MRVRGQIFGPRGQNLRVGVDLGHFGPLGVKIGSIFGRNFGLRWTMAPSSAAILDLSKTWLFARTLSFDSGQGPGRFDRFRSILGNFGRFWSDFGKILGPSWVDSWSKNPPLASDPIFRLEGPKSFLRF